MTYTTPAIVSAAESSDILTAAFAYQRLGLSVLACKRDKSPTLRQWKHLTTRRANPETIEAWSRAGLLQSVGIICGDVSGGLVVVDCDGADAITEFARHFPSLTDTYKVVSGSGQGAHFYLLAREVPPTTRTVGQIYGNIEMRSNGAYVIAPPSLHPSGGSYYVDQPYELRWVDNLRALRAWIEGQIREKHGGVMPPAANAQPVVNMDAYARAALIVQADRVKYAALHNRNNQLNVSAFSLGKFVREGRLSRIDVFEALTSAAAHLIEEDGIDSVRRTIASGLNAGVLKYETGK